MKNAFRVVRRKIPYIFLLLGIWIIVIMFIAGGVYSSESVINPNDPSKMYYFTVFQAMFGKSLVYSGTTKVFFKFNPVAIMILPLLIVGLLLPTFNRIHYRIRYLIAGALLLISGVLLFTIPATVQLGSGWVNPDQVTIRMGAPLIIAAIFTILFAIINIVIAIAREPK